jgi:hypothetical protein
MSMNVFVSTNWIKKLASLTILTIAASISLSVNIPVEAQTNPRPSIFNEYPYNRSPKRRVKRRPKARFKAKPNTKLRKQGAARNNRKQPYTQAPKKSPNEPFTIEFRAPGYPR